MSKQRISRRRFLRVLAGTPLAGVPLAGVPLMSAAKRAIAQPLAPISPLPTPEQAAWQRMELTMFMHFGVNTFTDREWGDGKEDPAVFDPTALDARQWVRCARDAGFRLMILTAKHHDGFCLWPSQYTEHCVKNSPWKAGRGDVVREFTDACHAEGMKVGLYLSPWDRNSARYGTDAYNDYFVQQLTELLTHYGPVDEMWFDGANGEGPSGKKQVYDWNRYYATIRRLAPHALIAVTGPDIRWVGNESGLARVGETSVQPAEKAADEPSKDGLSATATKWYPAECDVSIRPGWFYHASEDARGKSLDELMTIYFQSVGRNSVLLLNVPVDRRGLFADSDVARLREFGAAVRGVNENPVTGHALATGPSREPAARYGPQNAVDGNPDTFWSPPDGTLPCTLEIDLETPKTFNTLSVGEEIALGERVQRYHIDVEDGEQDGQWRTVARGTVIGQRNLHAIPAMKAQRLRLVIDAARTAPAIASFAATLAPVTPPAVPLLPESLALGRPAKASNVHSAAYIADRAFDGDPETRWATSDETRACWLEVDLGQGRAFDRVTIRELTPRITRFAVEYRLNESDPWQTALVGTTVGTAYDHTFPAVMGRYVRLNILDATFAPTLFEFGIYAARK